MGNCQCTEENLTAGDKLSSNPIAKNMPVFEEVEHKTTLKRIKFIYIFLKQKNMKRMPRKPSRPIGNGCQNKMKTTKITYNQNTSPSLNLRHLSIKNQTTLTLPQKLSYSY